MIQSFRQLKDRIKSIEGTRKITHAMELVSGAKLNRTKSVFLASKPYLVNMERVFFNLISDIAPVAHPLFETRVQKHPVALMVFSSDAGLCSTYNHAIIRFAEEFAERTGRENLKIITVGKEAFSYFRKKGYRIENSYVGIRGKFSENLAADIAKTLTDIFLKKEAAEVYVAYTSFSPRLRHAPTIEKFLPLAYEKKERQYYILEPGRDTLVDELSAKYLLCKARFIILSSLTSEHSSRMLAMKLATDNADELIETLTLQKNKARQFAITKEVLEIAMSAEALRSA
ncbi:MAG: ATP synthase F1 subunit gamma [Candidatus Omnitrophica bacterium]|nr:ATP synthase F1 subunit gamma [Candidatus Omnitrophota bacterium]MDD5436474.1 ATP synthase F1 subunit gamma [Candidatus Omnitrophota bacterium]